jgi:hypothetical protein
LHGKCLINYFVSLAIFHLVLLIIQIDRKKLLKFPLGCHIAGVTLTSLIFMKFAWLLAIIWIDMKPAMKAQHETKSFFKVFALCFGLPIVVACSEDFIGFSWSGQSFNSFIQQEEHCWVKTDNILTYGSITSLVVGGVVSLIITGLKVFNHQLTDEDQEDARHANCIKCERVLR